MCVYTMGVYAHVYLCVHICNAHIECFGFGRHSMKWMGGEKVFGMEIYTCV